MININRSTNLFETVVKGGYCVGCGSCAVINNDITISFNNHGNYEASILKGKEMDILIEKKILSVCPFSNESDNEDKISNELYSSISGIKHDTNIGYFLNAYAGHVNEGEFRKNGSSGGMGSWILYELFRKQMIDGVIHVKQSENAKDNSSPMFKFEISSSFDEILSGAKSRYYPVEMSNVLKLIKEKPGRYAIIGVSCFIKSLRLLAKQEKEIAERVIFTIGLICGHEKSKRFAEMLAWQCGIHPSNLLSIDFRKKIPNRKSSDYAVEVIGTKQDKNITIVKPMNELLGANWGHGLFKYKSCDYCDDVLNETADLTIGDAWLPEYLNDYQGSNVVVVRNPLLEELINDAIATGRINFTSISANKIVQSQIANFRHRREEIGYRIKQSENAGEWYPKKRHFSSIVLSSKRMKIQRLRLELRKQSHIHFEEALKNNDLESFNSKMNLVIKKYNNLYDDRPLWRKTASKTIKILKAKPLVLKIVKLTKQRYLFSK